MAQRLFAHLEAVEAFLAPGNPLAALFDFDGTLASLKRWPIEAQLSPLTRSLLTRLGGLPGVHLGILSGRGREDLRGRVGIADIYYGSCHGLEIEGPGLTFQHPEAAKMRPLLSRMARDLRAQSQMFPGALVEDKGLCVSLHYRNVDRGSVSFLQDQFFRVLEGYGEKMEAIPGKEVLEARPRLSWNKGDAVLLLLDHLRQKEGERPIALYLGDDQTDEDAFVALRERGLSICVGADHPTAARYFLQDLREVQRLLGWMSSCRGRRRSAPHLSPPLP
ncbi:MAG TPA: trehalose-phosphatase [Candidatus Methylomirabilis sp.]